MLRKILLYFPKKILGDKYSILRRALINFFRKYSYLFTLKRKTFFYNYQKRIYETKDHRRGRYLYASPVGKNDKKYLEKIIETFGHDDFDYVIFKYDNTEFSETIYKKCRFIYEEEFKWYCAKKYLTPDFCKAYEYIFFWDGDLDILDFSYKDFIEIAERNNLQLFQPALSQDSYYSYALTLRNKNYLIGRYVDYVEVMAPVFTCKAWAKFWDMLEEDFNYYGWGYDDIAKSVCSLSNMGIVDKHPVRHTKPVCEDIIRKEQREMIFQKYAKHYFARKVVYGKLK